jgi:hypothetical protein
MGFQLTHVHNSHLDAAHDGRPLFTYTYLPRTDPFETPKPHLHPVRTLAGNCVTVYRPHDHLWHHGIAMTFAHVSGATAAGRVESQNFWGGNVYVHGQSYQRLPHLVGAQRHRAWERIECGAGGIHLQHRVTWVEYGGAEWLDESRSLSVVDLDADEGWWALDVASTLRNVSSAPLVFGSPTTHGRPNAGYGGLFWRGPRSFNRGAILAAGALEGPGVMGQRAPWLAYTGKHDGTDGPAAAVSAPAAQSSLVFVDRPDSFRYPTKWFVRDEPYGCASFAVTFDEEHALAPGASFALHHRIVVVDGALTRPQIERLASRS